MAPFQSIQSIPDWALVEAIYKHDTTQDIVIMSLPAVIIALKQDFWSMRGQMM